MKLKTTIRFFDEKTKKAFNKLESGDGADKQLFIELNKAFDRIEDNAFCGIQIPKDLIPNVYLKIAKVKNLWKYNLPGGWRLIYSIVSDEIVVISIILEWFSHPDYEKRFKY